MTDTDAYRAAVRLLAASDKTKAQLCERLKVKGYTEDDAEAAVERLAREGFLNEISYAEKTVKRLFDGHYGKDYIRAYLAEKRFSEEALDKAEDVMGSLDFDLSAKEFRAELIRSGKSKAAALSTLCKRGFTDIN